MCGWLAAGTAVLALQAGAASVALGDVPTIRDKVNARTQIGFSCSPNQFYYEPEYFKVRMNGGLITSIHLLRADDGAEVATSHPYGTSQALAIESTSEFCMKVDRLEGFVDRVESRRQRSLTRLERIRRLVSQIRVRGVEALGAEAPAAGDPAPVYNTGLAIGWNNSTGPTPGECHNFYIETPTTNEGTLNFSSENAASSVSEQTKVSATVAGAFGAFNASASFAYSDKWKASANSGSAYFNMSSIWPLSIVLDTSNPLNAFGMQAESNGTLATTCGLRFMETVPAGMIATLSVHFGSSSQSTSSDIDAEFKASFGLDSLKAAVDVSSKATDTASYFDVSLFHQGGGVKAAQVLASGFGNSSADRSDCEQGVADACDRFISTMTTAATNAGTAFNDLAKDPPAGADLSFFALFPNGVAGAPGEAQTVSALPGNDILEPYEDQLEQFLTLINEIATLHSRASRLHSLLTGSPFNPEELDLTGYLDRLIDEGEGAVSYATSRTKLLEDLEACLGASSTNVEEVCSPIIHGGATVHSAYDFYDIEHGNPECTNGNNQETCQFLQQNTTALQYAASFEVEGYGEWAEDVIYVDALPPLASGIYNTPNMVGHPALVAFADRAFYEDKKLRETTNVSILALEKGTNLADIYTSVVALDADGFEWFGIWLDNHWFEASGDHYGRRTHWTSTACTPTFAEPCPINFRWSYKASGEPDLIQTTNPIENLFAP